MKTETNQYEQQAAEFLTKNALKFRATLSDTKTPAWAKAGAEHGHHYRVTISRPSIPAWKAANQCGASRLVFDFWGSVADAKAGKPGVRLERRTGQFIPTLNGVDLSPSSFSEERALEIARAETAKHPSAYEVLACISGDANVPDTFEEFCSEYGYESDSIKALQTFRRCSAFAKRLKSFFTAAELEQLSEIQ